MPEFNLLSLPSVNSNSILSMNYLPFYPAVFRNIEIALANQLQIGEWFHWDYATHRGFYQKFDTLGNLLKETPQNLVETQQKDSVLNGILGSWEISRMRGNAIELCKSNPQVERGYYGTIFFTKDQVRIKPNIQCGTGLDLKSIKKRLNNIWSIDDSLTLYMNVYGFENQKYKIIYLDRNEMRLLSVE